MAPPHIKSLQDLKGKRVGISDFNSIRHWAIQIQLKKAGLDLERDVEWVRLGVNSRFHVDAIRSGQVECAPVSPWNAEDRQKGRLQCAGLAGRSVSRRPSRADHRRHRTNPRRAAGPGEEFSQGHDSLLLVYS